MQRRVRKKQSGSKRPNMDRAFEAVQFLTGQRKKKPGNDFNPISKDLREKSLKKDEKLGSLKR